VGQLSMYSATFSGRRHHNKVMPQRYRMQIKLNLTHLSYSQLLSLTNNVLHQMNLVYRNSERPMHFIFQMQ